MDRRHSALFGASAWLAIVVLMLAPITTLAASPSPAPSATPAANADLRIEAHALLGGHVRPGSWTAVVVDVTNVGPPISGELRIRGQQEGRSQYGVPVELPTDAHQRFTLYAQTGFFGSRLNVDLVSGEQVLATQQAPIRSHDAYSPIAAVVAEQPQGLVPHIRAAMTNPNFNAPTVIELTAADLPPRVEAWAAIDRLVWQDIDAAQLSDAQKEALRLWLGAGGRLTILGGTTGVGTLGFDEDLLPFDPERTVDVQPSELVALLGPLPTGAAPVPAVAGLLNRGSVLARSGDDVIAAEAGFGRGSVTLVGFSPAEPWIADSTAASQALWHRLLPQVSGPALNPLTLPDDSQIVYALQNLPSIDLPPIEQLFVLLVAYIALIGPINYIVLRRLDRREWAWVTIPALVAVFAAGSYGLGATLKGSDVIVNEIAVVRVAQGSSVGIGQVYVGIYSPSRRSFDVSIPGGALLSNPVSQAQPGQAEQPLDVLFGESSSRLRNFEVGFGVLRGFRAEAPAAAPAVESDLRLSRGKLQGTITNRSDDELQNVAVVFGGGVAVLPSLAADESRTIDLDTNSNTLYGNSLSERIFGSTFPRDQAAARAVYTRRAVVEQLFGYDFRANSNSPLLLAWREGSVLDIRIAGDEPNRVGQGLFVMPLAVTIDAQQIFGDQLMRRTLVDATADQAWAEADNYYLSRGTMTVETRPMGLSGTFMASSLEIAITQGDVRALTGRGSPLAPLPESQQPEQDDPLGDREPSGPEPEPQPNTEPVPPKPEDPFLAGNSLPAFQLFDRVAHRWVEFPHPEHNASYLIIDPQRYADDGGAVLFRFVNRAEATQFGEEQLYFQLLMRLDGTLA